MKIIIFNGYRGYKYIIYLKNLRIAKNMDRMVTIILPLKSGGTF